MYIGFLQATTVKSAEQKPVTVASTD
jgi:hypothetical protein